MSFDDSIEGSMLFHVASERKFEIVYLKTARSLYLCELHSSLTSLDLLHELFHLRTDHTLDYNELKFLKSVETFSLICDSRDTLECEKCLKRYSDEYKFAGRTTGEFFE